MVLILICLLAFYVAWNLGANDVANAMGTSVGSRAITLRQALFIAGILEFSGAVLFGRNVSRTLATGIVNPALWADSPQLFLVGMLAVLLASGLWLNLATALGLPVSSSHGVVGAIAGFGLVAAGAQAIDWRQMGLISMSWVLTPLLSGTIAALFYSQVQRWILDHPDPIQQLYEWIPWLSVLLFTVFGLIVLLPLVQRWEGHPLPDQDVVLGGVGIAAIGLTLASWRRLSREAGRDLQDRSALLEGQLARFQVLSACFVAFAHGSNDVGNAIAPLAVITQIQQTGEVPLGALPVPLWILILGGTGIVAGLAIWGKKVMRTIGEKITALQPSSGFCAELATATTVLLASRLGLPVSTSHALVGAVVGVGWVRSRETLKLTTLRGILAAWFLTIPIVMLLGVILFTGMRSIPQLQ
ncbi:phosphate permease [Leptolyngbya sp. 'hensonii']|uniref:inorganic phosphate transporter n=1 Tax=Leptolyngbya sp. 'hensonii' TaxID=1922337 RepID=UPI00094F8D3B|nr:inorganic phosphate transporter [Leptolyngbya sp. 'hensonii']OLP20421.1 phosphate permease [Leptolyngbya sp. 'hensonii']